MEPIVLVTGGAGYIGAHACKSLALSGLEPVTVDNLTYGHRWAVKWGPLEVADIGDHLEINRIMRKYRPEGVLHFAGNTSVGESMEDPAKYYINNTIKTAVLLEAMLANRISNLVFSSTCATYGVPQVIPITETHPQNPVNPYGWSKLMAEIIIKDYTSAYGLKAVSLRYFNAAGADQDGEIGELHHPETHLIPLLLDAAYGKRPSITVYGTDYETPDGTCIRDYVHVMDLAEAHVKALQWLREKPPGFFAFNLGNGRGFSVREVTRAVETVTKTRVEVIEGKRRKGDPAVLIGDSRQAENILGWCPRYKDIFQIVQHARNFYGKMSG